MPFYSKTEFAKLIGIHPKNISVYKDRGKIIYSGNLINSDDPVNRMFIQLREVATAKKGDMPSISRKRVENNEDETPQGENKLLGLNEKKKELDIDKITEEIKLLKIKNDKATGVVVPSDPIIPIFLQHNQHILQEQKNADEEMLTIFGHKYLISGEDVAHIRGEWLKRRNEAVKKASDLSKKSIVNIINEYSERKGVGEHG